MKKIKNILLAFLIAAVPVISCGINSVQAATKEDVIAAARQAGLPESQIRDGINYLESHSHSSDQYDQMIGKINELKGTTDEAIKDYMDNEGSGQASGESSAPSADENKTSENSAAEEKPSEEQSSGSSSVPAPSVPAKDFSAMTDKEKDDYVSSLTPGERTQIIKELDRDKQMEIISSLIDAGEGLGLNITVDSLTRDKIEYSIRNDAGEVVDISAMGNIVDDTGIDYTVLIVSALVLILVSAGGLGAMAVYNRK